jgi:hypothetical protein
MPKAMKLYDWQKSKTPTPAKVEEVWVRPQPCHICKKVIPGSYGQTSLNCGVVWSCSKTCELQVQQLKQGEFRDAIQRATQTQAGGTEA